MEFGILFLLLLSARTQNVETVDDYSSCWCESRKLYSAHAVVFYFFSFVFFLLHEYCGILFKCVNMAMGMLNRHWANRNLMP